MRRTIARADGRAGSDDFMLARARTARPRLTLAISRPAQQQATKSGWRAPPRLLHDGHHASLDDAPPVRSLPIARRRPRPSMSSRTLACAPT